MPNAGSKARADQSSNWCDWYASPTLYANWRCRSGSTGGEVNSDSGIPLDNNDHLFKIIGGTGALEFWFDGALIITITSNLTSSLLQPYVWLVPNSTTPSDINIDYIVVKGGR